MKTWITDFIALLPKRRKIGYSSNKLLNYGRAVRTENPRWKKLNYKYLHEKHLRLQWLEDHRAIFLALQQKDSELAREASWRHLENSKNELIKIFKQDASISDFDDFFFAR